MKHDIDRRRRIQWVRQVDLFERCAQESQMHLYPYVLLILFLLPSLSTKAGVPHRVFFCFCFTGQYHTARPYIRVTSIPNFDPTNLPYWDLYVKEGTADTIKVGGTMAGEFTAGLSGEFIHGSCLG